jgi:HK97 gp10 family phage protein
MEIRAETVGLKEFEDLLEELPLAVQETILESSMVKAMEPVAEAARSLAPRGPEGTTGRDRKEAKIAEDFLASPLVQQRLKEGVSLERLTGGPDTKIGKHLLSGGAGGARKHMADSIDVFRLGYEDAGTLAVAVSYERRFYWGFFQEFGTPHHGASPFLRPAWDVLHDQVMEDLGRFLFDSMERTAAKFATRAAA